MVHQLLSIHTSLRYQPRLPTNCWFILNLHPTAGVLKRISAHLLKSAISGQLMISGLAQAILPISFQWPVFCLHNNQGSIQIGTKWWLKVVTEAPIWETDKWFSIKNRSCTSEGVELLSKLSICSTKKDGWWAGMKLCYQEHSMVESQLSFGALFFKKIQRIQSESSQTQPIS